MTIAGGNRNTEIVFGGIVIKAFRRIYGDAADAPSGESNATIVNIWQDRWLQNYATALIHRQWATNIQKYTGLPLMGGTALDGDKMFDKAQAEVEKLEEELYSTYELPPTFIIG